MFHGKSRDAKRSDGTGGIPALRSADRERILAMVAEMGELAVTAVEEAVHALQAQDDARCDKVISGDDAVDELEHRIDQECLASIALRQPVREDLRFVFAVLKSIADLERIGDQAVNIAEKAKVLNRAPLVKPLVDIPRMKDICVAMVRDALKAAREGDSSLAEEVCRRDAELDRLKEMISEELFFSWQPVRRRRDVSPGCGGAPVDHPPSGPHRRPRHEHGRTDLLCAARRGSEESPQAGTGNTAPRLKSSPIPHIAPSRRTAGAYGPPGVPGILHNAPPTSGRTCAFCTKKVSFRPTGGRRVLTAVRGVPGILHNGTSNLLENMRFLHEESAVSPSRRTAGAYGRPGRSGHSAQWRLQPPGEHAISARRKFRFALPADGGCSSQTLSPLTNRSRPLRPSGDRRRAALPGGAATLRGILPLRPLRSLAPLARGQRIFEDHPLSPLSHLTRNSACSAHKVLSRKNPFAKGSSE
jgi:phosphate transport system regulatory protein PhoU